MPNYIYFSVISLSVFLMSTVAIYGYLVFCRNVYSRLDLIISLIRELFKEEELDDNITSLNGNLSKLRQELIELQSQQDTDEGDWWKK
jgi:hypothetical protein